MMKVLLKELVEQAVRKAVEAGQLPTISCPPVIIERPAIEQHGDYASNIALLLAKGAKGVRGNPQVIATTLAQYLDGGSLGNGGGGGRLFSRVEVVAPGFLNFFLDRDFCLAQLRQVLAQGERYGTSHLGAGKRVQIEFVSANPTGPLHVGHGRCAAIGDVLANVLKAAGYAVDREYYINDVGTQMEMLGRSTLLRYRQLQGKEEPFVEGGYRGDYIYEIARQVIAEHGEEFLNQEEGAALPVFTRFAARLILEGIDRDLEEFGVRFDRWFSEQELYDSGQVEAALQRLKELGQLYGQDGALWLKSGARHEDKDRVVMRANGLYTYFASDIAYHLNKLQRGYCRLIDVWGADHHGYVPRLRSAIEALGYPAEVFMPILVQLVHLQRGEERLSMSTRSGQFATLSEVVQEVGRDATRFFYLMRKADAQLTFDLELAKQQSKENPVYYVQYAHARISSVLRLAKERGLWLSDGDAVDLAPLELPEEFLLVKRLLLFTDVIEDIAVSLEPHRLVSYLLDLVGHFHAYYNHQRIITDNARLTAARLVLVAVVGMVVNKGLKLLGVSAPERM